MKRHKTKIRVKKKKEQWWVIPPKCMKKVFHGEVVFDGPLPWDSFEKAIEDAGWLARILQGAGYEG